METETEVFDKKVLAWEEEMQPLVERLVELAETHDIALAIVGIVTDPDDEEGSVQTRGGLMVRGAWYAHALRSGLDRMLPGTGPADALRALRELLG